jgi:hypothetical protein
VCGVGIGYESKIAALRILSGPISDVDEAAGLTYAYRDTGIYSWGWGFDQVEEARAPFSPLQAATAQLLATPPMQFQLIY